MTRSTQRRVSAAFIFILTFSLSAEGAERSRAVRNAFEKQTPCPYEKETGVCMYDADHKVALVCGGPDAVENLAWLNRASHRLKTRDDIRRCRGTPYGFWMRLMRDVQFWR
jgi:hypothetical protein